MVVSALGQVTDDLWALQNDAERMAVDAQRTYAQARLGLVSAQVQQLQDTAGLLVALGGGWWKDPHDAAAPARLSSPPPPQAR